MFYKGQDKNNLVVWIMIKIRFWISFGFWCFVLNFKIVNCMKYFYELFYIQNDMYFF